MAKLSDLIDVKRNDEVITLQDVPIPVHLGFSSFEYIAEAYGKSFTQFEKDLNAMLMQGDHLVLGPKVIHLMNSLVYGMVRAGGTETTPQELGASIPLEDAGKIYQVVLNIYNRQNFQDKDAAKLKTGPKTHGAKNRHRNRRR